MGLMGASTGGPRFFNAARAEMRKASVSAAENAPAWERMPGTVICIDLGGRSECGGGGGGGGGGGNSCESTE